MYQYRARLERVVDGDTLDLFVDLGFQIWVHQRLRVLGIDAPERFAPGGREATAFLTELIPAGSIVTIDTQKTVSDKYGRWLADVTLSDGRVLSEVMAEAGHAQPREY